MATTSDIVPGVASITFRKLTPEEVIDLAKRAKLRGIEWGGDVHVPHGKLRLADEVKDRTLEAHLEIPAYGSYFRLNHSAKEGLAFETVLDTARALGAPCIRIWAGAVDSEEADEDYWSNAVAEAQQIADACAKTETLLAFEYHGKTLTNQPESARRLLKTIDRPNVRMYWQPVPSRSLRRNMESLEMVLPWLAHLHVFQWQDEPKARLALGDGEGDWLNYLRTVHTGEQRYATMEFVPDDSPDKFLRDAAVLRRWLEIIQRTPVRPARG